MFVKELIEKNKIDKFIEASATFEKVIYQYLEKAGQEDNREFKWVLEDFRVRPENFEIIMEALAEKMKEGPGKEKLIKLLKGLTGNYLVD